MASISEDLIRAVQHHQAGRLHVAEQMYRQVLALDANQPDALHLLGVVAHQVGKHQSAVELIEAAIRVQGAKADFHSNLGEAYRALGKYPEASACFRRALELKPDFAGAHNNLGLAMHNQGHAEAAVLSYHQALTLDPHFVHVHNNLGNALVDLGRLPEAIASYRRALDLKPDFAEAYHNLGNALQSYGNLPEAIGCFQRALELKPDYVGACVSLGNALNHQGQLEAAAAWFHRALQLDPVFAEAHNNLGMVLHAQGQLAQAFSSYQRALELKPDLTGIHNNLGNVYKDQGLLPEAIAAYRQALARKPDATWIHSNLVYTLHFCADYDAPRIMEELRLWNQQHAEPLARLIQPHENEREPNRRLRIGYVSPDFTLHPVGRFMLPLLQEHDHQAVEVYCYSSVRSPDDITERCRFHADVWRHCVGLSDEQVAQMIRADHIDILVDLTMHLAGNRILVFARKPAPVQVTYLAYCGTTGMRAMDYRLTDPYLDAREEEDRRQEAEDRGQEAGHYAEESIWLPETYWCYRPPFDTPHVNRLPALDAGQVTFGCLNNFCKVTEPTLEAWSRLLKEVPESRLLLYANIGNHREQVRDFFTRRQVAPERLTFVGRVPIFEYFRGYERIDITLDPFPYGGGTTTCDSLWMGVPVVSLAGQTAVGRSGLSILSNVGLADLVARDTDQYVRLAADLARAVPRLTDLRATLRGRMLAAPLMDGPRFARAVEAAYREMWRRWCEKMKNGERRTENEE